MLPTFLVIGAARSGTTWMHYTLSQHPEVFVAPKKEIDFFTSHWEEGTAWYERFFRDANGAKAIGEVSPIYTYGSTVTPTRIASVVPDARLIYIVRNPVERSWSHYTWERYALGHGIGSFHEALERPFARSMILGASRYGTHIENYLGQFSRDQLLIIVHEDLAGNAQQQLERVEEHIGVDPTFVPDGLQKPINARYRVRREAMQRLLFRFAKTRARLSIESAIPTRFRAPIRAGVKRMLGREEAPAMPTEVRDFLLRELSSEIEGVETFLGRRLDEWRQPSQ